MLGTVAGILGLVTEITAMAPKAIQLGLDLKALWDRSRVALDSIPPEARTDEWNKLDAEVKKELGELLDPSTDDK